MGLISEALGRIKPSATMAMTNRAAEMKAAGQDVIGLGAGEPDFDTPAHIAEAGIAAIREGKTRYTAVDGIPQLKAAICHKFERDNGLSYTPSQVSVSSGGKQVLYNAGAERGAMFGAVEAHAFGFFGHADRRHAIEGPERAADDAERPDECDAGAERLNGQLIEPSRERQRVERREKRDCERAPDASDPMGGDG